MVRLMATELTNFPSQGHMDFNFEVSRSLAACQGTLLLVDAAQGIQAQTVANFYLAFGQDIKIIPVINKVLQSGMDMLLYLSLLGTNCTHSKVHVSHHRSISRQQIQTG